MSSAKLHGVFLGLTITSTWGNGHATTYRALVKEFAARGHRVTFLERDVPWYAENREFNEWNSCDIRLYGSLSELEEEYHDLVRSADFVLVGSYVPDGIAVGDWVLTTAQGLKVFYDIDTPVTLSNLSKGKCEYLARPQVSQYDLYLSFTGGPTLSYLEERLHSPEARALYCSVDPSLYYPMPGEMVWNLAYLGTYAEDRQPVLQELLVAVAEEMSDKKFVVAGPQYPGDLSWPANVDRIEHLPASDHLAFYNSQAFALNLTRRDMVRAGYSPSVRLFEAAACGVPIITDVWPGLEELFTFGSEILPARKAGEVASYLQMPLEERMQVAERARGRILRFHTAGVRAEQLEEYLRAAQERVSHQASRSTVSVNGSKTITLQR